MRDITVSVGGTQKMTGFVIFERWVSFFPCVNVAINLTTTPLSGMLSPKTDANKNHNFDKC